MKISVIVPTLNEKAHLPGALASVLEQTHEASEILVVDGGSHDGTQQLVEAGVRLLQSEPGRARQMNAGAEQASGEALLFLHADSRLPAGGLAAVAHALEDPAVAGGGFHKSFRSSSRLLRRTRWRTELWFRCGALFGDQALFARAASFERCGGFRESAPTEDLDLALRLGREERLVLLEPEVSTSARRLEEGGILRTWLSWWWTALRTYMHRDE